MNHLKEKEKLIKLAEELKKYDNDFVLSEERLNEVLYWLEFFYSDIYSREAIAEVCDYGICVCGMSKYVIYEEKQADSMNYHLICSGCDKKCDGGDKYRSNTYTFESKKDGAWVFNRNRKQVEEWYCQQCKFELLCGDCGSPHELKTELYSRPEFEDFYLCFFCEIDREETEHKEKHMLKFEPDLDCSSCQNWVEKWEARVSEAQNKV